MRLLVVTLATTCMLAAAGCVVSPLSQGESGDNSESGAVDVLAGTWSLPCTADADSVGSYYTVTWLFGSGQFFRTDESYLVSDCASDPATAASYRGTYRIGAPVFPPSGYYCVELDLDYELLGPRYDIFRVAGSNMFLGDPATGSGLTEAERPTDIDIFSPFMEQ